MLMRRMGVAEQVRFGRTSPVCAAKCKRRRLGKPPDAQSRHFGRDTDAGDILRQWGNAYASNGARRASPVLAEQVRFRRASPVCATRCKRRRLGKPPDAQSRHLGRDTDAGRIVEAVVNAYASNRGSPSKSGFGRTSPVLAEQVRFALQDAREDTWQASRRPKPAPWTRYRR